MVSLQVSLSLYILKITVLAILISKFDKVDIRKGNSLSSSGLERAGLLDLKVNVVCMQ